MASNCARTARRKNGPITIDKSHLQDAETVHRHSQQTSRARAREPRFPSSERVLGGHSTSRPTHDVARVRMGGSAPATTTRLKPIPHDRQLGRCSRGKRGGRANCRNIGRGKTVSEHKQHTPRPWAPSDANAGPCCSPCRYLVSLKAEVPGKPSS